MAWATVSLLLIGCGQPPEPEFLRRVPWSLGGSWLILDTHTHTRFSDGALSPTELAERALLAGCDALAITDHSDADERAATNAYFDAIDEARRALPWMLLFAGLEWNIPPYGGREHVTVLTHPDLERSLAEFKQRYEETETDASRAALHWLDDLTSEPAAVALFYNHPSRKDATVGENLADFQRWRAASPSFLGFEGAPGHQRMDPVGAYRGAISTRNRWDPVVAEVGGVWDQLLDRGTDAWAALASSDYHNDRGDWLPCEFARIHAHVDERTHGGILEALHAGAFWADHGPLLNALQFQVTTEGLPIPAVPGESFRLGQSPVVRILFELTPGPQTRGEALQVELIGNGRSGKPELLETRALSPGSLEGEWQLAGLTAGADGRSAYFRLRVRKPDPAGPDLMAYTNPIRVYLP